LEISNKLLSKYGLEKLSQCTLNELNREYGIGQAKSCQILALFEIFRRFNQAKPEANKITSAKELAQIYLPKMSHLQQEQFVAVYLDTKNKIIGEQILTIGTLNTSLIHPREVYHGAIKHLANSLIIIHNHPSGDPAPSIEDLEVTEKLQETGEIVGIKLLDHLIIGREKWWSWKENRN
jgi:DNA repair protein RadC